MNVASLILSPTTPIQGIYYISQYGTSGYAQASRGYLFNYFSLGIPITWDPLYFDDSKLNDDDCYDVIIKSLINKKIPEYDIVMLHSTPDLWPSFWKDKNDLLKHRVVNGYCTWETNIVPKKWVECINTSVNEVCCPSNYNKVTFIDSGVKVPIRVVPHIFLPKPLPNKRLISLIDDLTHERLDCDGRYTFYSIGEFNARKSIGELIHTYCKTFSKNDNVKLILKTHYKNYSVENKLECKRMVSEILNQYPNHPKLICLFDNLSSDEILALHSLGDCYISLTKSEGFGLTIFDAYNYGKKIITTGYSGQIDFLGLKYEGLVKYKLGPVEGMSKFSDIYTNDQTWAHPDLEHASYLMKLRANL